MLLGCDSVMMGPSHPDLATQGGPQRAPSSVGGHGSLQGWPSPCSGKHLSMWRDHLPGLPAARGGMTRGDAQPLGGWSRLRWTLPTAANKVDGHFLSAKLGTPKVGALTPVGITAWLPAADSSSQWGCKCLWGMALPNVTPKEIMFPWQPPDHKFWAGFRLRCIISNPGAPYRRWPAVMAPQHGPPWVPHPLWLPWVPHFYVLPCVLNVVRCCLHPGRRAEIFFVA